MNISNAYVAQEQRPDMRPGTFAELRICRLCWCETNSMQSRNIQTSQASLWIRKSWWLNAEPQALKPAQIKVSHPVVHIWRPSNELPDQNPPPSRLVSRNPTHHQICDGSRAVLGWSPPRIPCGEYTYRVHGCSH